LLGACSNINHQNKPTVDNTQIIDAVKKVSYAITKHAEKAEADSLLRYYSPSPDFLAFSSDGKMRDYDSFKKLCVEYYDSLKEQKVTTIRNSFHIVDSTVVIQEWLGNINAFFKNGDIMKMKDYAVTNVLKKIENEWKIIHSHESSLPPEIIKASK
jgi:ketosteroid isomerase-like protein